MGISGDLIDQFLNEQARVNNAVDEGDINDQISDMQDVSGAFGETFGWTDTLLPTNQTPGSYQWGAMGLAPLVMSDTPKFYFEMQDTASPWVDQRQALTMVAHGTVTYSLAGPTGLGNAIGFDGSTAYGLSSNQLPSGDVGGLSVLGGWIYPTSSTGTGYIISVGNSGFSSPQGYGLQQNSLGMTFGFMTGGGSPTTYTVSCTSGLTVNAWNFVLGTFDPNNDGSSGGGLTRLAIYINGVQKVISSVAGGNPNSVAGFGVQLGATGGATPANFFAGRLAHLFGVQAPPVSGIANFNAGPGLDKDHAARYYSQATINGTTGVQNSKWGFSTWA